MPNRNLQTALQQAGVQPDELAGIVGVDERTMRRWLAGGTPYARHRAKIARALDRTEPELWPQIAPAHHPATPAPAEVIAAYLPADAPDAPGSDTLIQAARERIDLLLSDYGRELFDPPGRAERLLAKARDGCQVRILVSEPDESLAALLGVAGIQIRRSEIDQRPIIHRGDDDALAWVTFSTDYDSDQPAPVLLHARREQAPGLFQRLADHFQRAWEQADPIQTKADIEYYLTEWDGDSNPDHPAHYDASDEDDAEPGGDPAAAPAPAQGAMPDAQPPAPERRRWPGQRPG